MARHKNDAETTRLLGEIEETRSDLGDVIGKLLAEGTTKAEVARAAGWNPGYLTEFLENSEKRPTTKKIKALIAALGPLVDASKSGTDLGPTLDRLGERYRIEIASLANPTRLIPASAPNYVSRFDVDHALTLNCETKGDYAIDGQPKVGLSTALLYVKSILEEKGHHVRLLNAGSELMATNYAQESKTGIIGLLAAALTRSEASLDLDFFGVQEEIRTYLTDLGGPFALLLDDINQLKHSDVEALKRLLRDWATRRAGGEEPFTEVTTWTAMTSHVHDVRRISNFQASYTVLRWFRREEVRALAAALAPYAVARGAVHSSRWTGKAADAAWGLFAGQPQLTHLFLWDRHLDGLAEVEGILTKPPSGSYKGHLDSLARSLISLFGREGARVLVASLGSAPDSISASDLYSAEWLGLATEANQWSCPYYQEHLPRVIEVAAGARDEEHERA